jgi:hypothetical protein
MSQQSVGDSGPGGDSSSKNIFRALGILLGVLAVTLASGYTARRFMRRRKLRTAVKANRLHWQSSYRDRPPEINIAPRRASNFDEIYLSSLAQAGRDSTVIALSSRDPMATHFVPPPQPPQDIDEQPEVYIGPPRDEDGHVLHNVDII